MEKNMIEKIVDLKLKRPIEKVKIVTMKLNIEKMRTKSYVVTNRD